MIDVANLAFRFLSLCKFCIFYELWAYSEALIQVWVGVCAEQAIIASLRGLISGEGGDRDSNQPASVNVSWPSCQEDVITLCILV